MRIFLDTSGLIALSDRKDTNHKTAGAFLKTRVKAGARFVLGRNVLVEYIDGVTKRVSKLKAAEELDNILNSKLLVIEPVSGTDWNKAIQYFKKYDDQRIDLTDCLSFAIMERLGLDTALTFDNDFKTHGFVVVS
ncbi:MAG: PIN domain-containing protein [ANME-2 cluster archaeon]|nr:PIN domain-containing protein [ANME-2 cluster archaeon]